MVLISARRPCRLALSAINYAEEKMIMESWLDKAARYWKAIIASATPVFLAVQAAVTDDRISSEEVVAISVAVLVALGVLAKGNAPAPDQPGRVPVDPGLDDF
jgi:hypothetical protein